MVSWYLDEGLVTLRGEWRLEHPNSTVYTIGDSAHSKNPDVSQHAPDDGGPKPGDSLGEVDAADFMPGKGVTRDDLRELFLGLHRSRDPRILYVIFEDEIFSSVVRPWEIRPYGGSFHGHVHVSVNDNYANNTSDWKWEKAVARTVNWQHVGGKVPDLRLGDEDDALPGFNMIKYRVQPIANALDNTLPDLDLDGVYGPKTAQKVGRALKASGSVNKLTEAEWQTLLGLGQ